MSKTIKTNLIKQKYVYFGKHTMNSLCCRFSGKLFSLHLASHWNIILIVCQIRLIVVDIYKIKFDTKTTNLLD